MSEIWLLMAGLFLPLFPLSMVFNELFNRLGNGKLRSVLLLVWPQLGLAIVSATGVEIPGWILAWALLTALLYGFRALVLREVNLWAGFVATSAWAVLWPVIGDNSAGLSGLVFYGLGFSVPLALLVLLSGELEKLEGQELLPGMPVEAFIKTSERSPLNYLTKPLVDYFNKAFRED